MIYISIAEKTESHPFFDQGSKMGYTINGNFVEELILYRDTTYLFNVDSEGHPFYFTTDPVGGSASSRRLTFPGKLMGQTEIVDKGVLQFTVPHNVPDKFYYQCGRHPAMGGAVKCYNKTRFCNLI